MSDEAPSKPPSPALRFLRAFWAVLLISLLAFSILMAVWGDLREGLMLRVLDHRYNKSFTLAMPYESHVWIGEQYLGESQPHPLAANEPEDTDVEVEGMSVLEPRVYVYEEPLLKHAVACEEKQEVAALLDKLAPEGELVWSASENLDEPGFVPVLLRDSQGRLDFANLGRVDWFDHEREVIRAAFLVRMEHEEARIFTPARTRIWSDRLYAPEGEFWAVREQYDGFPPSYTGQVKTVWQWHFIEPENQGAWLKDTCGIEDEPNWVALPPKED